MADLSAKALAQLAGTDPKRMRRFIRAQAKGPTPIIPACGQGNRYALTQAQANALVKAFRKAHAPKASDDAGTEGTPSA